MQTFINARKLEPIEGKIIFIGDSKITGEQVGIACPETRVVLLECGEISFDDIVYWFPWPSIVEDKLPGPDPKTTCLRGRHSLKQPGYLSIPECSSVKPSNLEVNLCDIFRQLGFTPQDTGALIISRIEDIGRAQEKLKNLLDDNIFETTSKHNPYWNSEYEPEADKLDDLRRKISWINEMLWDLMGILRKDQE